MGREGIVAEFFHRNFDERLELVLLQYCEQLPRKTNGRGLEIRHRGRLLD